MARKLCTIRQVSAIRPIPDADNIECAVVDGWTVVVKKGDFKEGDLGVFFEIDSWIPEDLITGDDAPLMFLEPKIKEWEGKKGVRLRTIKLRGQLSQGLLIPSKHIPPYEHLPVGSDLTESLHIDLWHPTIPAQLMGKIKGTFPSFISKTDQERIQNCLVEVFTGNRFSFFEVTVKLDGSSMTVYKYHDTLGVCSRNMEQKISEDNMDNLYVKVAHESGLLAALDKLNANIAVQGELMGPKIQGNHEKLTEHEMFVFDIYDCDKKCYVSPATRMNIFHLLVKYGARVEHVPILELATQLPFDNLEEALEYAEGPSLNAKDREGVVFKRSDGAFSFKVISNEYLLKEQ